MRTWTLAFLCGILFIQQFTLLPNLSWAVVCIVIAVFTEITLVKKCQPIRLISAALLGVAFVLWSTHAILSWNLPKQLEGKPLQISGYIANIPNVSEHRTTFLFALTQLESKSTHALIKLSWQNTNIVLHAGDQWQFVARLKRVHGLMNPGGFDYEARALQEGIRANGYIVNQPGNKLLSSHWYHFTLNRIRQNLKEKIEKNLVASNTSPWITALALGERQNISADNWQVLRNTGTNHLMAIAGLHIGLMSGLVFVIVNWLWRRVPYLTLKIPSQQVGSIAALFMAVVYSALAGFSIPTQRACIMLSIALIMLLLRRKMLAWQAWCVAMLSVLLLHPLCVLSESFWLSFGSVALIIFGVSDRLSPSGLWWKLGRIQWVVALGLIPPSIWLFQQCSFVAFLANSIAIPWVGFIVVPLTLLGSVLVFFSTKCGSLILLLADKALNMLWQILTYLSHLSWASWYLVIPDNWVLIAACIGMIILLLPAGFPGKYLGIIWLLPLIFYHYPTPRAGNVWFTLLDVGQGLSTVIQTKNHLLVFDAGPKLGSNYDMGESVVTPFLHSIGARKIDLLVVSHGDNDHIGGTSALFHYFKIKAVKTSAPEKFTTFPATYCLRGDHWVWDDVAFEFLYPAKDKLNLDNDSSCVLRITNAKQQHILLTGDIEKFAETDLVQTSANLLETDILVAPHHGSKTSGLNQFINDVKPQYVFFPVGYRNRYHFPNSNVMEKYRNLGAKLFATDDVGAIQVKLNGGVIEPVLYRQAHKHYWNVSL